MHVHACQLMWPVAHKFVAASRCPQIFSFWSPSPSPLLSRKPVHQSLPLERQETLENLETEAARRHFKRSFHNPNLSPSRSPSPTHYPYSYPSVPSLRARLKQRKPFLVGRPGLVLGSRHSGRRAPSRAHMATH